ncbi:MAG: DUF4387 domain-containing protein [Acetobacterales bacterium]
MGARLSDLAAVIRSKNAGPFEVTVDILFEDEAAFARARQSPALTPKAIADAYRMPEDRVLDILFYEPARAIKINLRRAASSGSTGDTDVYGAQHYAPLLDVQIDDA